MRPLDRADLPSVATLRRQRFGTTIHTGPGALEAYMEDVFLRHPWPDPAMPSLVCEDGAGRVAGFVGIIPRPMMLNGSRIRVAISTQFMVDPAAGAAVAAALARALLNGPQDLTLADIANERSRRLFVSLGADVAVPYSLSWTRALRPWRRRAARVGAGHWLGRTAARLVRGPCNALDARATRRPGHWRLAPPPGTISPATPKQLSTLITALLSSTALQPAYDARTLTWVLAHVAARQPPLGLRTRLVHDAAGQPAGWFAYRPAPGGTADVIQVGARRLRWNMVVEHLLHDAWHQGAVALSGRLEPGLLPCLAGQPGLEIAAGPWTVFRTTNPAIRTAILAGDVFLSRLDGEWWLQF